MNTIKLKNAGLKWTDAEEVNLFNELSQGLKYNEIAYKHGRSLTAIDLRIKHIAYRLYQNNESMETIMEKTKLTEPEIQTIIDWEKLKTINRNKITNYTVKEQTKDGIILNPDYMTNIVTTSFDKLDKNINRLDQNIQQLDNSIIRLTESINLLNNLMNILVSKINTE